MTTSEVIVHAVSTTTLDVIDQSFAHFVSKETLLTAPSIPSVNLAVFSV